MNAIDSFWASFGKPQNRKANERRAAIARSARRTEVWRKFHPSGSRELAACRRCSAPAGEPCTSPTGKPTRPHAERIAAARAGRP